MLLIISVKGDTTPIIIGGPICRPREEELEEEQEDLAGISSWSILLRVLRLSSAWCCILYCMAQMLHPQSRRRTWTMPLSKFIHFPAGSFPDVNQPPIVHLFTNDPPGGAVTSCNNLHLLVSIKTKREFVIQVRFSFISIIGIFDFNPKNIWGTTQPTNAIVTPEP